MLRRNATFGLITAGRPERIEYHRQKNPSVDIEAIASQDPTQNGAFIDWLVKQSMRGIDVSNVKPLLERYDRAKASKLLAPESTDINRLTPEQIDDAIDIAEEAWGKREHDREQRAQAQLAARNQQMETERQQRLKNVTPAILDTKTKTFIGESDGYRFSAIPNRDVMVTECDKAGGNWCVGYGHTSSHWNRYMVDKDYGPNPKLYVIEKSGIEGSPWLLFTSDTAAELKDDEDEPVDSEHPILEAISKVIGEVKLSKTHDALEVLREEAAATTDTRRIWQFAQNPQILNAVAQNPSIPKRALLALAADLDADVRYRVAWNPNTPPEVLIKLASDDNMDVRYYVAWNPSTPPEALIKLASDDNMDVRYHVAWNPNTPPEVLIKLASDDDMIVRGAVARNPNTPPETRSIARRAAFFGRITAASA